MKITAIKQQVKRSDRYSIFVDGKYSFSLSDVALLDSGLATGHELTAGEVQKYKHLSADDKVYNQALRYVALRSRSEWEVKFYLERKGASPPLITEILNKLSIIGMIDDEKFTKTFINDRKILRPTSRRKIILELHKKHVADEVINKILNTAGASDKEALRAVITSKRRQAKYHDDLKLMQYLARQGFNYDDIKSALNQG